MVFVIIFAAIALTTSILLLPRLVTSRYAQDRTFTQIELAPRERVAIVFGAGLWHDGQPTPVLRDRVATAASLYFAGKVEKLLMSGDNSTDEYNEPAAMRAYALELGVPDEVIVLDHAGRRTYDTCYRVREVFGIRRAILVTQSFHLPRALYTCNHLGVKASGVRADRRIYRPSSRWIWNAREVPATLVALWEVHLTRPQPVLGEPQPIFPLEMQ